MNNNLKNNAHFIDGKIKFREVIITCPLFLSSNPPLFVLYFSLFFYLLVFILTFLMMLLNSHVFSLHGLCVCVCIVHVVYVCV